jgi:hypothetical protein
MRRLSEFITEDTNQFGPGTDLIVSLVAVLMVMTLIISNLYQIERRRSQSLGKEKHDYESLQKLLEEQKKRLETFERGGNFRLSGEFFPAGDFQFKPVTKLTDLEHTRMKVNEIVREYQTSQAQFPFIFVVGHSNQIDDPAAEDKTYGARLQRNWEYAGRRAGVIADLIQANLTAEQKEKIVVMSAGEFDLRAPADPFAEENAWVEVVFGRDWKLPAQKRPATSQSRQPVRTEN